MSVELGFLTKMPHSGMPLKSSIQIYYTHLSLRFCDLYLEKSTKSIECGWNYSDDPETYSEWKADKWAGMVWISFMPILLHAREFSRAVCRYGITRATRRIHGNGCHPGKLSGRSQALMWVGNTGKALNMYALLFEGLSKDILISILADGKKMLTFWSYSIC